jgi:hypothetical protein
VRAAHRWLVRGVGVAGRGRCRGEVTRAGSASWFSSRSSAAASHKQATHQLVLQAFHRADGGQGKTWMSAHHGARRGSRQGCETTQNLQDSGTMAEHTV